MNDKSPHDGCRMRSLVLKTNLLFTFGEGGLRAALSLIPDLCNTDHSDASRWGAVKVEDVAPLIPWPLITGYDASILICGALSLWALGSGIRLRSGFQSRLQPRRPGRRFISSSPPLRDSARLCFRFYYHGWANSTSISEEYKCIVSPLALPNGIDRE